MISNSQSKHAKQVGVTRVSSRRKATKAARATNAAATRVVRSLAARPCTPSPAPAPAPATPCRRAKAGADREVPCLAYVKAALKGNLPISICQSAVGLVRCLRCHGQNYSYAGPVRPSVTVAFAAFVEEKRSFNHTRLRRLRASVREVIAALSLAAAPAAALAAVLPGIFTLSL
ncbi:hypothetical protein DL95DRAFT_417526 [Leptodontidium sp. 2 PMI_412]|nr:hypothetical protein DL95DRAFT_417526 [Leptodontidium sp. 2 PMI_412]